MTHEPAGYRLYGDLADWWPLISPPAEYDEEAAFAAELLGTAAVPVRRVLELGSGGGHNASYLKALYTLTLVDASAAMLASSRRLNPECEHRQGDMRAVRLGRTFDGVLVHDAIDYMLTEDDLQQAVETAFAHCRPGGVAVFVPDHTAETFRPGTDHGGGDAGGRAARYLAWTWDPHPGDSWTQTDFAFLLRAQDGTVRCVHESHRMGLFSRRTWLRLLAGTGFRAHAVTERTTEDRRPREVFVGHRGAAGRGRSLPERHVVADQRRDDALRADPDVLDGQAQRQ